MFFGEQRRRADERRLHIKLPRKRTRCTCIYMHTYLRIYLPYVCTLARRQSLLTLLFFKSLMYTPVLAVTPTALCELETMYYDEAATASHLGLATSGPAMHQY